MMNLTRKNKFNTYQTGIYRWKQMLVIALSYLILYLGWQSGVVIIISGYLFYKLLWFSRGYIYRLGLSRFFLLAIVFYLSIAASMWVKINLINYPMYMDKFGTGHGLSYVTNMLMNMFILIFVHWADVVLCFAYGVILYILNVEVRSRQLIYRDLSRLNIDPVKLNNFSPEINLLLLFMLIILLPFISWLDLMLVVLLESLLLYLSRGYRITILAILMMLTIFTIPFSGMHVMYLPHYMFIYLVKHGISAFCLFQMHDARKIFIVTVAYLLLPYLSLRLFFEVRCKK